MATIWKSVEFNFMSRRAAQFLVLAAWVCILSLAFVLRTAGLFRGLAGDYVYHPDEPKQVTALDQYLRGQYVWYTGDLCYDGYPYGLNHVDEWLLRPALAARERMARFMDPAADVKRPTGIKELTQPARALRVLYGLSCVVLTYAVARGMALPVTPALAAALVVALAPLSVAVSHFASGDIGVDLFGAFMLLSLCGYSRRHRRIWILLAGMSAGMAYACKYNGLLAAGAIIALMLLEWIRFRSHGRSIGNLLASAAGFVLGALLLTPAFFVNPGRTWRDMLANFTFIRNYDVAEDFLARPLMDRVWISLSGNTGRIVGFLGWGVVVLALAGAAVAVVQWLHSRRLMEGDEERDLVPELRAACAVYPFAALLVSLVSKPQVQPFHFSYLQIPLVLGAAYLVSSIGSRTRVVAVALWIAVTGELAWQASREHYFWQRDDNVSLVQHMAEDVFKNSAKGSRSGKVLKEVFLEPENAAVFRNRYGTVESNLLRDWKDTGTAPVPSVPYPRQSSWIFLNGPVFPRNDRLFHVEADKPAMKDIVCHGSVGRISLGIRSGARPVEVRYTCGGRRGMVRLAANGQSVIRVLDPRARHIGARGAFAGDTFLVPLRVEAVNGDAWVEVIADPFQEAVFTCFGGQAVNPDVLVRWHAVGKGIDIEKQVGHTRYLDSEGWQATELVAGDSERGKCLLAGSDSVLAAGVYELECDVEAMSDSPCLELRLVAFPGVILDRSLGVVQLGGGGAKTVRLEFEKTYAPYQCAVEAVCVTGRVLVAGWRISPAVDRTMADLVQWASQNGRRPSWQTRFPSSDGVPGGTRHRDIRFGDSLVLRHMMLPAVAAYTGSVPVWCAFDIEHFPVRGFAELAGFIHFIAGDRQVAAVSFSLAEAMELSDTGRPVMVTLPADLPAGDYEMRAGVHHVRTGRRQPVHGNDVTPVEQHDDRIVVGRIHVRR